MTELLDELDAWLDANWDPDLTVADWWDRLGLSGWAAPSLPPNAFGKPAFGCAEVRQVAIRDSSAT